jgi:hypothetical protein
MIQGKHEPQMSSISFQNASVGPLAIVNCLTLIVEIIEIMVMVTFKNIQIHFHSDGIFTLLNKKLQIRVVVLIYTVTRQS